MTPRLAVRGLRSALLVLAALTALALTGSFSGVADGALLPPRNPARSLALDEHVRPDCKGVADHSATCLDESVAMLNAGRRSEHLGPLVLPRNWSRLTVAEQIFVLTELERTARGLPPDTGLAADWNAAARAGANAGMDPTRPGRGAHGGFLSIWAGGQPNPIIATVGWIYDDGYFPDHTTQNIACAPSNPSGCWGHRDAILRDSAATACEGRCAVGAAYSPTGFSMGGPGNGRESYAEVFGIGAGNNPDPLIFRWADELPQLPACERVRDSCSWSGKPRVTPSGVLNVRGLAQGTSLVSPWFAVSFRWTTSSTGSLTLEIATALGLRGVSATAAQGSRRVVLHVTRSASTQFVATGQLGSGQWIVTIVYRTPAVDGPPPSSTESIRFP